MERKSKPEPVVHSSLGLKALCQRLDGTISRDILELGPVRNVNIGFWSRFGPSMYIADLRSSLPLPVLTSEDSDFVAPDWDSMLGMPKGRCYDVVLAWDLFNYLELPALSSFIAYLRKFCRPGTVVFSLIFDQKEMPDQITLYGIADESHLNYEYAGMQMRTCPRHQPRTMAGVMSRFRTLESFRLKNGVVEYLFEYEGE